MSTVATCVSNAFEPVRPSHQDPHFNYRATILLVEQGPAALWNWFDSSSWYPLGRDVGSTVYPALPFTAAACWWLSRSLGLPISLRACCVYLPAVCSAITCIATYGLTLQVVRRGSTGAGLYAAAFVAVVPSYLSRSCAGAYDNECVAIPAMVATFALYLKALNTPGGSIIWATLSALAYGYMVLAWGGHVFVVNLIALHCLAMCLCGRITGRLYVTYSTWYVCAGLLAVQTPFVRAKIMGGSSEYLIAQCAFAFMQVWVAVPILKSALNRSGLRPNEVLVASSVLLIVLATFRLTGVKTWTDGRLKRLLDPTSNTISLVASVSEHQTSRWSSLFKDLHLLQVLFPAGLILLAHGDGVEHCTGSDCIRDGNNSTGSDRDNHENPQRCGRWRICERANERHNNLGHRRSPSDAKIFAALFGCFALYFNGIMQRCSLIFAPAACVISGIAASRAVGIYAAKSLRVCHRCAFRSTCFAGCIGRTQNNYDCDIFESAMTGHTGKVIGGPLHKHKQSRQQHWPVLVELAVWLGSTTVVLALLVLTCLFVQHAVWMAAIEFSSPSVIFAKPSDSGSHSSEPDVVAADGYIDDFREAYSWLRLNTPEDAKVLAWWDYGYQIAALANRTTFVDNNTWNNTAIAAVGRVLVSSEVEGARLMREMGADLVLIVFGGGVGWPDDDIGKMLWPIRIASEIFPDAVRESDFLTGGVDGELRIDSAASRAVKESLLVKCAYHRFEQLSHQSSTSNRGSINANSQLRELHEVYTTTNWIVRIFALNPESNRI